MRSSECPTVPPEQGPHQAAATQHVPHHGQIHGRPGPHTEAGHAHVMPAMTGHARLGLRLAGQARERQEAEGGQGGLGLSKDEKEDESEIWSIGKVELSNVFSND